MKWWDEEAGKLQRAGFDDCPHEESTSDDAYRVLVYTRQDVVLIVSYPSSLNRQIWHVKLLLSRDRFRAAFDSLEIGFSRGCTGLDRPALSAGLLPGGRRWHWEVRPSWPYAL
jgi:hypothetical protein